ncbi:hypothetical protein BpHYR1_041018 [Brachionus plicatilis]|uniref:Uncharacterized protein n=1 Tax=Brachionus plicatilis TaxID=10195 RepID=A0A3M7R3I8_BRAPC|nr:hypothetical protein BpHYR1_041018 [Brachionus plicatilis]
MSIVSALNRLVKVLASAEAIKKSPLIRNALSGGRLSASSLSLALAELDTKADWVAYVPSAVTNCWVPVLMLLFNICSSCLLSRPAARFTSSSTIGMSPSD